MKTSLRIATEDRLHSAESTAELLGIRPPTIWWWWNLGKLQRVKIGRSNVAKSGGFDNSGGNHYNVHEHRTYHAQTTDGDGVQAVLDKHSNQTRHFYSTARRMNK